MTSLKKKKTTKTKTTNLIHVIDMKEQRIKPMDNFELSEFINDFSSEGKIEKRRYFLTPNQDCACFILDLQKRISEKSQQKGVIK
jgi:hypothetical protein